MEKVFFTAGDIVQIRQDLPNKPTMLVASVDMTDFDGKPSLLGISCIWFSEDKELQRARFNTKDLEKV